MENVAEKLIKEIELLPNEEIGKMFIKLFCIFNPLGYRGISAEELENEIAGIEILIAGIDRQTLAEMVKRAVNKFVDKRRESGKIIFNINYIMEFYKEAFNYVYCDRFELPLGAERLESNFDEDSGIIEQKWRSKTGEIVDIKCYAKLMPESKRPYSHKDEEQLWTDLDSLN